ncbi:MAG: UDP-glucose/GDP-mannose dehydrogenase family protein, partial [Pseudomonadota bacterium]
MNIAVVGTGYVGLVVGTCLADMGHQVLCVDNDASKISALLGGSIPIYEPGLDHLVVRNLHEERLGFTLDIAQAITSCEVVYIAVGTPSAADGSADLSYVFDVARAICAHATRALTVVIKSTVPVGTADKVRAVLAEHPGFAHEVVSNPEFLKEGTAIEDFRNPDRIIVGCAAEAPRRVMERLYKPLLRTGKPILFMDNRSAEMSKYASNAFLATRISFINELARLCELVDADIDAVRRGAGSDSRIGLRFFFPGAGYGGSCFPKDVRALLRTAHEHDLDLHVVSAAERVNEEQKRILARKVFARFGPDLSGLRLAMWGLAFKPRTDDMREAPSRVLAELLTAAGARVVAYDPEAMIEARRLLGDTVELAESSTEALEGADALLVVTEWNEFRSP